MINPQILKALINVWLCCIVLKYQQVANKSSFTADKLTRDPELLLCELAKLSCSSEPISKNVKQLWLPCNWGRDKFSEQPKQIQIGLGLTVRLLQKAKKEL